VTKPGFNLFERHGCSKATDGADEFDSGVGAQLAKVTLQVGPLSPPVSN
jgi:hypothetical protein